MAPESLPLTPICQLKKYEPVPWILRDQIAEVPATTPSEWFSQRWPKEAELYRCPFLESAWTHDEQQHINPIALNEIFFASILAGEEKWGHRVVYYVPEERFYFKDPRDGQVFKPTTEGKLKSLLSLYLLQCAEELKDATPKFNLFVTFRKDKELIKVVTEAKSLLAVSKDFFGGDSPNIRLEGHEVCVKAAKTFIHILVEVGKTKTMTLRDSYTSFLEFCGKNGMVSVERRLFEDLAVEIIKKEFKVSVRNDIPNALGKHQRGWLGIGLKSGVLDLARLAAN